MKKTKFNLSLKAFKMPTPKRIARAGNALASASIAAAGISATQGSEKLAIGLTIGAFAGKLISGFFYEENNDQNNSNQQS